MINDVTINGTSIVENGVAEMPIAVNNGEYGLVKVNPNSANGIAISSVDGCLTIVRASNNEYRSGANNYRTVTPYGQHMATFYGLTKAAGVDMSNSNNTIGTYTDEAKGAIQHMIGADNLAPYESDITADQAYAIGELFMLNGKLHRATAAISALDVFTVGTNCEIVNASDVFTRDVQIDSTSVVNNGVANIPLIGVNSYGVVKVGGSSDSGLYIKSNGQLAVYKANDNQIKSGTNDFNPIAPTKQHVSTFYGLAKAAGDTTQSASSNAVGTYTDEAKAAIRQMLGIPNISYPTAITVTTPPDNVDYEIGNSFDKTGMVVTLIWSTGETRILLENEYTVTPSIFSTLGTQNITITYRGTEPYVLTTTQEVSVVNIIPDTWAKIVQISKAGVARNYFEVGDIINDTYTINNNVITNPWIIMDFRTVELENGETYDNVPIIQMQYTTHENVVFDEKEEIEATEETAQSGFYYFGMVTEENVWTALNLSEGTTIPYGDYDNVYKTRVNSWNPIRYGLNNWKLSFARQYLNNSGIGWATAQHDCDVLPTNANSMTGFKSLISSDMATALHPIKIETKQSNYFGAGTDITYDTFWLASVSEMNLSNNSASTDDGEPWEYYKQLLESETKLPTGTFDILKKYDISA